MKLQKKVVVSSDLANRVMSMGNKIPPWYPDYKISDWYWTTDDVTPSMHFYYNIVGDDTYIQYGKDGHGWASARFFGQSLEVVKEVEHEDGSITATVSIMSNFFIGRKNSVVNVGYPVNYKLKINNKVIHQWSGQTDESFTFGKSEKITFDVTVKPQETINDTAMVVEIVYPTGQYQDRDLIVGVGLFNPNPLTYIPMAIRKSGNWKDLNSNKGKILRRVNGVWVDKSQENVNTSKQENKGKNRIRKNGKWYQLPKMNNGNTQ